MRNSQPCETCNDTGFDRGNFDIDMGISICRECGMTGDLSEAPTLRLRAIPKSEPEPQEKPGPTIKLALPNILIRTSDGLVHISVATSSITNSAILRCQSIWTKYNMVWVHGLQSEHQIESRCLTCFPDMS